ncbi:MAG TPA: ester cyclase [Dehalococcoidia bacterium]|nr:ester cyclase [Dehalococcoidia bacterium]
MSIEENKDLVCRWIEELNRQNWAAINEFIAANFIGHNPERETHRQDMEESFTRFYKAFPDYLWTIDDMVAEGEKVAVRMTGVGTHKGEYAGAAPTEKQVKLADIGIFRIAGGKIVEDWAQRDILGFLQQLGILPSQ